MKYGPSRPSRDAARRRFLRSGPIFERVAGANLRATPAEVEDLEQFPEVVGLEAAARRGPGDEPQRSTEARRRALASERASLGLPVDERERRLCHGDLLSISVLVADEATGAV